MQTKAGGKKLRETMIKKHGSVEAWKKWMRENAAKGGRASGTGGFYYSKIMGLDTHIESGRKGGRLSKRTKAND